MNRERELLRSALSGWDTLVVGDVGVDCVFDNSYEESLGAEGTAASALVDTSRIQGAERDVSIARGVTEVTVETVDGRTEGPFVVETQEPGEIGTTILRLRLL